MMYLEKVKKWLEIAGNVKPSEFSLNDKEKIGLSLDLMEEEFNETIDAFDNNDKVEFLDGIIDMIFILNNMIHFSGISKKLLDDAFDEVLDSNFSKFCYSEDEANQTVELYAKGDHPDKMGEKIPVVWEEVHGLYVIKRAEDKKIMKSYVYKKADLKKILKKHS